HCPLAHLASFLILPPPTSTLFPYTTLFRSVLVHPYHLEYGTRAAGQLAVEGARVEVVEIQVAPVIPLGEPEHLASVPEYTPTDRSEEHTSELQSRENLVCRLLLEKKKKQRI